ncbi:MAG: hypothetical protein HJJLKODD_02334 [Phycisphaerae bacterium]|nr:hypothetical protein [Phycisphaerae bacterium]
MANQVKRIPDGHYTLTPHLVVQNCKEAMGWYKKALGAEEICQMTTPDGQCIVHAEMKVGNSMFYMCEANPQWGARSPQMLNGTPVTLHLYVEDADAVFNRAVQAGATVTMPLDNAMWGDRYGKFTDPYGHYWSVATHIEDVTPEEMTKRMEQMFSGKHNCG